MRRQCRVDANHSTIVRQLRDAGYSVLDMSRLGNGAPDIAAGKHKANHFFEIKDPNQPPSKRRLTDDERAFHAGWLGQVDIIESVEQALKIMGA